jgi:hypothetical protein
VRDQVQQSSWIALLATVFCVEISLEVAGVAEDSRKDMKASLLEPLPSFYFFISNYNSYPAPKTRSTYPRLNRPHRINPIQTSELLGAVISEQRQASRESSSLDLL